MSRFMRTYALPFAAAVVLLPGKASAQANSVLSLLPTEDRRLEVERLYTGALSAADYHSADDNLLEAWELEGRAGQTVTIDLASDQFDARLYVTGPGLVSTLRDEDGGGGCNSRLTVTFLENGTFRVVAGSLGPTQTGTYTIQVSEQPHPVPSYGCGEVNPALLAELPTEGRTLEVGALAASILGPGARVVQDGRSGEAWHLSATPGQRLSVTLESDDFDAFLYLTGPGLDEILTDDDGAGELNSRIDFSVASEEPYTVVASTLSAGGFGAYVLRVEEAADLNTLPLVGSVALGQPIEADLLSTDPVILEGRRGQVWGFEATAGQRVAIDLRSDDFDTYLYLVGPGLLEPLADDDGGDNTNSQITTTLRQAGTYRIVVSSYGRNGSGTFSLSVTPR